MFYEKSNKKAVNNDKTSCLNTDIVKSQWPCIISNHKGKIS